MTRPRTSKELIATAIHGEQKPCGFLADHFDVHYRERKEWTDANPYDHTPPFDHEAFDAYLQRSYAAAPSHCPICDAHNARMRQEWNRGETDARRHLETFTDNQTIVASMNAHQAWKDVDAVEPAVSYISGYSMVMSDAFRHVQNRKGRAA